MDVSFLNLKLDEVKTKRRRVLPVILPRNLVVVLPPSEKSLSDAAEVAVIDKYRLASLQSSSPSSGPWMRQKSSGYTSCFR